MSKDKKNTCCHLNLFLESFVIEQQSRVFIWLVKSQTDRFSKRKSAFSFLQHPDAGEVAASLSHLTAPQLMETAQTSRLVTDIGPDHLTLFKSESRWLIDGASHDHRTKNPIQPDSTAVTRPGQKQTTSPEAKWQQFSSIM